MGDAFSLSGEGHELSLHIGGEAGIFLGGDIGGDELFGTFNPQRALAFAADVRAAFLEFADERAQVLWRAAGEQEIATGDRSGDEKRPGFDAVGDDGMLGAVQLFNALHADRGGAGALDPGTHLGEKRGEIGNFRLEGAVFEGAFALGENRGGQDILGAGNGDLRKANRGSAEALGAGLDIAVRDRNLRTELLEGLDVEIDGARTDGASSWQGNSGVSEARDQRAEGENGGPHGFDQLVGSFGVRDHFRFNGKFAGRQVRARDAAAHMGEKLGHGDDVAYVRDVFQRDRVGGEQRSGHGGQSSIFCAADLNGTFEFASALDLELIHGVCSRTVPHTKSKNEMQIPRLRQHEPGAGRETGSAWDDKIKRSAS